MTFPSIHPALDRALLARDYLEPTPVQAAVLEAKAGSRDLLVSAQTGSGKTVAFGLAMAHDILGETETLARAAEPLALIIAPTRELALQVHRELSWLYGKSGARIVACVGGMDARAEARAMNAGCHIVVGTPGRLRDHLQRGQLNTSKLAAVVLDEADEMLDLGFREDLTFILDATPESRRTLLFSATLPKEIVALARTYQKDALRIDTLVRNAAHSDIEYRAIRIAPNEMEHAVVNVLRFFDSTAALVFCATRDGVRHLQGALQERGFTAVALSGELTQNERSHALQALRDGRAQVCVATDVAARGLDLPDLGLVIHADLPNNKETLLHRSGRTGRAGKKGISLLLVSYPRRRRAEALLQTAGVNASWSGPPTAADIRHRDQERMLKDPVFSETPTEEDAALAQLLLAQRSPEELARALARLFSARLPAPEDLFEGPQQNERPEKSRRDREPSRHDPLHADGPQMRTSGTGEFVWFRLNIGRDNNADPKWLLPMICRAGHVTKPDIGAIRIFDTETRFEIAAHLATRFAAASRESKEKGVKIEAATGDMPERRPRKGPHGLGGGENQLAAGDRPPFKGEKPRRFQDKGGPPHRKGGPAKNDMSKGGAPLSKRPRPKDIP